MENLDQLAAILAAWNAPKPGYGPAAHNVHKPVIDPNLPPDKQREIHSNYVGQLADHMGQLDEGEKLIVKAEIQRVLSEGGFNS
jgi:hypothetical protein